MRPWRELRYGIKVTAAAPDDVRLTSHVTYSTWYVPARWSHAGPTSVYIISSARPAPTETCRWKRSYFRRARNILTGIDLCCLYDTRTTYMSRQCLYLTLLWRNHQSCLAVPPTLDDAAEHRPAVVQCPSGAHLGKDYYKACESG